MDGTDFISLLLWDREAMQLIGKSANLLKESSVKTSYDVDECSYPLELNTIYDKKVLFKIVQKISNIGTLEEVYTVRKLTDVQDLLEKHCPSGKALINTNFNHEQGACVANDLKESIHNNGAIFHSKIPIKRHISENEASTIIDVDDETKSTFETSVKRVMVKKENDV